MKSNNQWLLLIDGIVNVILGILLLSFPLGTATVFGVPEPHTNLYPALLGGVLFGIGIALILERYGSKFGIRGLGLPGAIVINICGAGVLTLWLLFTSIEMPAKGHVTLWTIAILVFVIGVAEIVNKSWKYE